MFELLCIISMALRKVFFSSKSSLILKSKERFIDNELSEGGGLHVTSKDRYFFCCLLPSLSWNTQQKKPRSFFFSSSTRRVFFLSQVSTSRSPEKKGYFKRIRSTKAAAAAVAGSSRGHVSAARTDPDTRDPPDSRHFLSQALVSSPFGNLFQVSEGKTKPKHTEEESVRIFISHFAVFISDSAL